MKRHRNVKIVATLGPASNDYAMIRALHEAGADVFRLNMSHGDHEEIRKRHAIIRQVEKDLDSPIAILADLQGPKLRVGVFANGEEELVPGASFRLDLDKTDGDATRVCLPHTEIFDALEPGAHLLVNDGKINPSRLISVLHYDGTPITARFIVDQISQHAGARNIVPLKKAS